MATSGVAIPDHLDPQKRRRGGRSATVVAVDSVADDTRQVHQQVGVNGDPSLLGESLGSGRFFYYGRAFLSHKLFILDKF